MIRFALVFILVLLSFGSAEAEVLRVYGPNGLLLAAAETRSSCDVSLTLKGGGAALQSVDQTQEDLTFVPNKAAVAGRALSESEQRLKLAAVKPGRWAIAVEEGAEITEVILENCDSRNES